MNGGTMAYDRNYNRTPREYGETAGEYDARQASEARDLEISCNPPQTYSEPIKPLDYVCPHYKFNCQCTQCRTKRANESR